MGQGRAGEEERVLAMEAAEKEKQKDVVLFYLMVRHHGWNSFFLFFFFWFDLVWFGRQLPQLSEITRLNFAYS